MERATFLPPVPEHSLLREHLLARLSAWDDRKVVIIHGPAGQGKSTLAAQYAGSAGLRTVWFTLGSGYGDPAGFLSGLSHAIQTSLPGAFPVLPPLPRDRFGQDGLGPAAERWLRDVFGSL